jgi:hypothetical protein
MQASSGNFLQTFRETLSVPSLRGHRRRWDRLSRNVGKKLPSIACIITQKRAVLICFVAEAWHQTLGCWPCASFMFRPLHGHLQGDVLQTGTMMADTVKGAYMWDNFCIKCRIICLLHGVWKTLNMR